MSRKHLSRRDFLKLAGAGAGATALLCSGLGYAATRAPRPASPEIMIRKDISMNKRILVAFATRAGSTAEVAVAIGEVLATRGFSVDIKPVRESPCLDGYQAAVLGSAVRFGAWLPEAVGFIKANQPGLTTIPVALFTVHILNLNDDDQSRTARLGYLKDVSPLLNPADQAFFPGKIDPTKLSFFERSLSRMVKAPEGDYRDWGRIRGWAQNLFNQENRDE